MANEKVSQLEVAHLVSMANDIAANFSFHEDAIVRTTDHIRRFWAPRMHRLLLEYTAQDSQGLSEIAVAALDELREEA